MIPTFSSRIAGGARLAALVAMGITLAGWRLPAQQGPSPDSSRAGPTRAQLEALAAQLDQEARTATSDEVRRQRQAQVQAIRERLRDGDFQPGDRIAMVVRGDTTLSDTVVVRAGRIIQVGNLPPIGLQGVLRTELEPYLTKQLGRYLKNPEVEATALVQIAVLGPVGHPGFFSVPSDLTLTDAIMLAGGPTQGSDVNKTVIRRNDRVIQPAKVVRQAFASGTTLDQLNLRAGDQIVVGEKTRHDWFRILSILSLAAGTAVSVYAITR